MLRDVIRKEIMDSIGQMKFVVTFAVVTVLIISGMWLGGEDFVMKYEDADGQLERNYQMLKNQDSWFTAMNVGIFDTRYPSPLSIIDHGIDNSLGRTSQVAAATEAFPDESRNLASPILAVFGEVDITFVVKIILSLFVILLTFDAISGEKELGTLKLALSNRVSRSTFILGKMFGGFTVILVSLVVPIILGLLIMFAFYGGVMDQFTAGTWGRFVLIILVYLIYLFMFFAVGLFVSASTKKSSTSFIVLLMIWVLFVTIIPRISLSVTESVTGHESYAALQQKALAKIGVERETIAKEAFDQKKAAQAAATGKLNEWLADAMQSITESSVEIMQEFDSEYRKNQDVQITTAEWFSRALSPTSAMTFAVQNLAGSGYRHQKEYVEQLREFQKGFRQYTFGKIRELPGTQQALQAAMTAGGELDVDKSNLKFTFKEESFSDVLSRSIWDIAILMLMAIIFFSAAFVSFMRYDVR